MKVRTVILLLLTHGAAIFVGFAGGLYTLPIISAPPSPTEYEISLLSSQAQYTTHFSRDLKDSDALHWGEGPVSIGLTHITLVGDVAPGPEYKLYLASEFVETEADFNRLKANMVLVGDVKTFKNFVVQVPQGINVSNFNTVVVWCEAFGQFITSAQYR
jgi:hypothetical protein